MAAMPATVTRAEVAVELREAVQAFTAAQRRLRGRDAKAGGLSFAQFHLLRRLAEVDECPASKLAAGADLSPPRHPGARPPGRARPRRARPQRHRSPRRPQPPHAGRPRGFERKRAELEQRWQEALADLSADQLGQAAQVLRRMAEVLDGI